jgi:preprotein translocase subunit SecE
MNLIAYLQEVKTELTKISWPSRQKSTQMTLVVLGASLAVGLYIGGLDYLFTNLLGIILK